MVGGAKREVGGECEVVDPVGVCGQRVQAVPGSVVPDFDCFVLRGGEEPVEATPAHAGHRTFVACEGLIDATKGNIPYTNRTVFGGGC